MQKKKTQLDSLMGLIRDMYEEKIPFNRELGMKIESITPNDTRVRFDMDEKLIGNYQKGVLHGGVISSVLDATGGLTASVGLLEKIEEEQLGSVEKRLGRVGTIDLRIDYLRPGQGNYFIATGSPMRTGRRVSVTRMELHNDDGVLIAVGTGTYVVG